MATSDSDFSFPFFWFLFWLPTIPDSMCNIDYPCRPIVWRVIYSVCETAAKVSGPPHLPLDSGLQVYGCVPLHTRPINHANIVQALSQCTILAYISVPFSPNHYYKITKNNLQCMQYKWFFVFFVHITKGRK